MVKLDKARYGAAYDMYKASEFFFPLIGAVLLDEQDGVVYVDDQDSPAAVYVEHAFGFAQIFGSRVDDFERELKQYLLIEKRFLASKVRLYAPFVPDFLGTGDYDSLRSFRQRFVINPESLFRDLVSGNGAINEIELCAVDEQNVSIIERKFGVVGRFWRTPEDFIRKANATVACYRGEPASICYSAAEADRRVEIDVLTLPEYRARGVGKFAVTQFVKRCFDQSLQPLWDCFSNNTGSMLLCRSVGFTAPKSPYLFFTINK